MASFEMKTMLDHAQELTAALSSEPMGVAGILIDKKLIQNEVLLTMMNVDTPTGKAGVLIKVVMDMIAMAPEKFVEFLKIVSGQPWTNEIAKKLHSTYQSKSDIKFVQSTLSQQEGRGSLAGPHPSQRRKGLI